MDGTNVTLSEEHKRALTAKAAESVRELCQRYGIEFGSLEYDALFVAYKQGQVDLLKLQLAGELPG